MLTIVRTHFQNSLYQNSYLLIIIRILGMGSGFLFWALAARILNPDEVGIASGIVSAAMLVAGFGQLGLGYGIVKYIQVTEDTLGLLNWALVISALASIFFALVFIASVHYWVNSLSVLQTSYQVSIVFVLFVCCATVTQLLNWIFLAKQRLIYSLFKNVIQTVSSIILIIGFAHYIPNYLSAFFAYATATLISIGIVFFYFLPIVQREYHFKLPRNIRVHLPAARFSIANFAADQLSRLPDTLLPLLVLAQLGPDAGAYFFVAWALGRSITVYANSVGESLFAEGSNRSEDAEQNLWRAVKLGLVIACGMALAISLIGRFILAIYGSAYVTNGLQLLCFVSFAAIPSALLTIYVNAMRIQNRLGIIALVMSGSACIGVLLSYIFMRYLGLTGAGLGWLLGQAIVLCTALIWQRIVSKHDEKAFRDLPSTV